MNYDKKAFLEDIGTELIEENIAIFAGAGMSSSVGFVNWKELLRPIAEEMGLDVEKEHDLVALAQYHCNDNSNNRSQLNKRLVQEFSKEVSVTENHKILARLPIHTYWTTNYDKLIEQALTDAGQIVDVKYTVNQLAVTKNKRNSIVYKMHGDIDHPDNAVITKDDYEKYHIKMEQYISALKGDLISKTFIFIGFSFSDPNIDYILSRVRIAYNNNQRRHYCFLKKVTRKISELEVDYQYRKRKQELFINDLKRFNIKVILVNEYTEITVFLEHIEKQYKKNTIFISGAAHKYCNFGERESLLFLQKLSSKLVSKGYKIVSGFGLGVGSSVISGALQEIYTHKTHINDQLILRPFPQTVLGNISKPDLWKTYRKDMISYAGIALIVFGNKKNGDEVILSKGVEEEYKIAKELKLIIIPLGLTGYIAEQIWTKENVEIQKNPKIGSDFKILYEKLGDSNLTLNEASKLVLEIISKVK